MVNQNKTGAGNERVGCCAGVVRRGKKHSFLGRCVQQSAVGGAVGVREKGNEENAINQGREEIWGEKKGFVPTLYLQ